jgi:hypothetical protein
VTVNVQGSRNGIDQADEPETDQAGALSGWGSVSSEDKEKKKQRAKNRAVKRENGDCNKCPHTGCTSSFMTTGAQYEKHLATHKPATKSVANSTTHDHAASPTKSHQKLPLKIIPEEYVDDDDDDDDDDEDDDAISVI